MEITQVIYNGQILAELEDNKIATILCRDMKMSTDIEILFADPGSVTYNNTTVNANPGQRVIVHCARQQMVSDIVITVPNTMYQTLYTANNSSYTTVAKQIFTVLES